MNGKLTQIWGRVFVTTPGLWLGVILLVALGLPSAAIAQGTITSLSPNQVAQFYPLGQPTFEVSISISAAFGGPPETATVGGQVATILPTPSSTFATLQVPTSVTATVGNKTIQVCRNGGDVCTTVSGSETLEVLRSQVVYISPSRITIGASVDYVYYDYLSQRSSYPDVGVEVFIRNPQGQETSLGQAIYTETDEGFPGLHYGAIAIPSSAIPTLGKYRLRIVESFEGGTTPITTDSSVTQAEIDVVAPAEFVTPSPLPPANPGVFYTQDIAAAGGSPYLGEGADYYAFYTVTGGAPPSGLFLGSSFSPVGTLSGTTNGPTGIYTFDVTVEDRFGIESTKTYRMGVQNPNLPALSFTSGTLTQGRVAESYFAFLQATGGTNNYTFAVTGGALPPGLTLDPEGYIFGAPTQMGNFSVTILAEDSELRQATATFQIQILAAYPPLVFTTNAVLPNARVGDNYTLQFAAAGGLAPYHFFQGESSLPPNLSLTQSGLLSGIPQEEGTYQFDVAVVDARSFEQEAAVTYRTFTLHVLSAIPAPSFITAADLPPAEAGSPYSVTLETKDGVGPLTITVPLGLLPPGLVLSEATGVLSGTPESTGEWSFLATVTDSRKETGTRLFSLVVQDEVAPLTLTTQSPLPDAGVNASYSVAIVATGGVQPYAFSISEGSLPNGLTLNASTGVISGTPTAVSNSAFTVTVSDSMETSVSRAYTLRVTDSVRLITQSPLPGGTVDVAYSQTIVAQGGNAPYQFSIISGALPSGLAIDATTGVISGTPTAASNSQFTVRVHDSGEQQTETTRVYQLRIRQPLELTVLELPVGTRDESYSVQFGAQGGEPGYTFSLVSGTLQSGLTLTPAGLLSGTATEAGSRSITVRVTDAEQSTAQRSYTLEIRAPQVSGGSLSLTSTVGVSNSQNEVDVTLSAPQEEEITGEITLSVNSATSPAVDDPTIQFISGGRTIAFVIPAGETSARFGSADTARFQTGTTAGTIVFTATLRRGGEDATPTPAPQASLAIPTTPPSVVSLTVTRSSSNLTVVIVGFAPERNITTAVLEFSRRAGAPGNNPEVFSVNVGQAFQQWFSSAASQALGSQFKLTIPVTLDGDPADITGLTVRLTGPAGTGNSQSATF